jgi:hypothetical protein
VLLVLLVLVVLVVPVALAVIVVVLVVPVVLAVLVVRGFEKYAPSCLRFVAQLYDLPPNFKQEVHEASSKFMKGPNGWLSGVGGRTFFRGKIDLGLNAAPRCRVAECQAAC